MLCRVHKASLKVFGWVGVCCNGSASPRLTPVVPAVLLVENLGTSERFVAHGGSGGGQPVCQLVY